MTLYQIGREGLDQQIVGISDSDGDCIEFLNTEEANNFISELEK
jgi:hypothetical protein